jgi:hypothetical protein
VRRADNLMTFAFRMSRNFGNLNLLEPSGHVQACSADLYYCILTVQSKPAVPMLSRQPARQKHLCWHYISHFPASDSHPGHVSRLNTARFEILTGMPRKMLMEYDTMSLGVAVCYVLKDRSAYIFRIKHSIYILESGTTPQNVGNYLPVDMAFKIPEYSNLQRHRCENL